MSTISRIDPRGLPKPPEPSSHCSSVEAGRFLFVAGQVALDETGESVGFYDIRAQTRQVFSNISEALASERLDMDAIVKLTTYLTRGEDIDAFNEVRGEEFPSLFSNGQYPPNTLLIINRLARKEFLIEVEAIAAYVS